MSLLRVPEPEIRSFYERHQHDVPADVLLARKDLNREDLIWLLEQMRSRNRIRNKIPEWYDRFDLVLPPELNLSQSSSTATAKHKAKWVTGSLLDLTAGSGIDGWQMSQHASTFQYVEPNAELLKITQFNFEHLGIEGEGFQTTAEAYLKQMNRMDGTLYLDPSRRSEEGSKTVALHRMSPDLTGMWATLLAKSKRVIVKLSPLFDLTAIQKELKHVRNIEVVSLHGEVKEILVIAEEAFHALPQISAIELQEHATWSYTSEPRAVDLPTTFGTYLYDPSPALVKANLHDVWAQENQLSKPIRQASVYFSETLLDSYPGRIFKVIQTAKPYKISELPQRLSIVSRYYHEKPEVIRKKLRVGESENEFLFAVGKNKNERVFIHAVRMS